ncbi:hypothetical protein [Paucibacter sp. XJ19-41]|uniref:hypothetical protein n=1 Tax=Paucibacter sp. XJ19-41 TaxID=2927824 RepID=UPI00234AAC72|nr:hypothetical protein [Paucibacter sp. XJ19-41]MDC6169645.1 hypothetical protein [Paucibacter sp. XJ19-41]
MTVLAAVFGPGLLVASSAGMPTGLQQGIHAFLGGLAGFLVVAVIALIRRVRALTVLMLARADSRSPTGSQQRPEGLGLEPESFLTQDLTPGNPSKPGVPGGRP